MPRSRSHKSYEPAETNMMMVDSTIPPLHGNGSHESNFSSSSKKRNKKSSSSCRLLPHGHYTLLIATCSMIGWCSSLFQDGCDYAKVTGHIVTQLASRPDVPYLEFGLGAYREPHPTGYKVNSVTGSKDITWETNYSGTCTEYPFDTNEYDIYWKVSKGCAFLALVIGGGGTLFVWCSTCFVFSRGTWKYAGYELLLASFCQAVAFIWFFNTVACRTTSTTSTSSYVNPNEFDSNTVDGDDVGNITDTIDGMTTTAAPSFSPILSDGEAESGGGASTCMMYWGSKANVIATVCWFISGVLVLMRYPEPIDKDDDADDGDDDIIADTMLYNDDDDPQHLHGSLQSTTLSPDSDSGTADSNSITPKLNGDDPIHPHARVI